MVQAYSNNPTSTLLGNCPSVSLYSNATQGVATANSDDRATPCLSPPPPPSSLLSNTCVLVLLQTGVLVRLFCKLMSCSLSVDLTWNLQLSTYVGMGDVCCGCGLWWWNVL